MALESLIYLFTRKSPQWKGLVISVVFASLIVIFLVAGVVTFIHTERTNDDRVSTNVSMTYDGESVNVSMKNDGESMEFVLPDRDVVPAVSEPVVPAKSEPQEIKVVSEGETRLVLIVQAPPMSESALLDLDTGEPIEGHHWE